MTSCQGESKGFQQVNSRVKVENQGDVNGSQGDDESVNNRVNENVQNGCKRVAVQGNDARQVPPQQPQGSLVHWEKFLHVRSIKVMLVEDDDCTRHIVTALLRNCNYDVIQAANGFQAWKILENLSNHIDIVLTEVVMPCLSGIGLLCKIMSHKTRKNVPVIMMSSHDSMGLVFKCLSKGAVDFLVKPIRKNELKILWQHVWRRCHSSSGSGSESGVQAQKSVNSKGNLGYDNSGTKYGDENESTGDGSEDGSRTQSSWTKQAIECESPEAASTEHPDSTCGFVIRPTIDSNDQEAQPDDGRKGKEIAINQCRNSEMLIEFPIEVHRSNKDKAIDNNMADPHIENEENEGQGEPENIIDDSNGLIVGEIGLKRLRETENGEREVQNGCDILRHSELSAFTRYKTNSSAVKGTPGIIASCSQPVNRSNIVKKESECDVHSDGYLIYQGSSEQVIPKNADGIRPANLNHEPQSQHIHHHHHVHHYHNLDTEQPLSNQDDFGLNTLAADAPYCGSSNIMGGPVEGNLENYSLNKGASGGSMHGSNLQNEGNPAVNFEVTNAESNADIAGNSESGAASGSGSGGGGVRDHHKSAQREAALTKFRQKREMRCFQKKVRYQNRKKLSEQRPRVRGQFVKGTSRDNLNNAADG